MKLSGIVSHKNLLDSLSSRPAAQELLNETLSMINVVQVSGVHIPDAVDHLIQAREQVSQAVEQFEQQFEQLKQSVHDLIEQREPEYFQNSMNLYNTGYCNDSSEHIRNRHIVVDPVTAVIIQQRLKLYTSWQHPGMVIRPAHAKYVEDLVACDPMYFVDTRDQLLELTESWFTPEYQRRLRRYVIEEYSNQPAFINLPADQFGLIYAFHFFEYRPWPVLQQYLRECFDLLRPGGVLAFTYNNCDLARRVGMVEHYSACYTPGRLVRAYAQELGYETVFDLDDDSNTSWLELRRPGNYSSIRGGQTLAAMYQRSTESNITNVIDKPPETAYNELNMLLNIAQRLGIDLKQCITKGQYSTKKLRRSIEQSVYPEMLTEQMIRELFNQRNNS
jgi:predicted SAM-dependent methyltransferase